MDINNKKIKVIAIFAFLIAIVALFLPENIDSGIMFVVNNTNLAPSSPGHAGAGERMHGVTYYANNSPILVYLFFHTTEVAGDMDANVSINGTVVVDQNMNIPATGDDHFSFTVIVPQYANYSVRNNSKVHHYEWREYQIITGNVSTVVTSSGGGDTTSGSSGGVAIFMPDRIINTSNRDITNYFTQCSALNSACFVGVTNYPNSSIGDTFQSHFTTPINFSNITIFSVDDNSRGIVSVYVNEVLVSSNIDFYQAAESNNKRKISLGGIYPPGYYNITLRVTGKNVASTGYNIHITQMTLWMEGQDNYNQSFDGVSDVNNYFFNQTFINGTTGDLNLKLNKSGYENITGPINMSANLTLDPGANINVGSGIDLTRNGVMYLNSTIGTSAIRMQTAGVSRNSRFGTTFNGAGAVSIHQFLLNQTGTNYSNGDGAAFLILMTDNQRQNNAIGKIGMTYENITNNQGKVVLNPRWNSSDTAQNVPSVEVWGSDQRLQINSGNLVIKGASRGITMNSTDNNQWCVNVTNAGALQVSAGACL